MAHDPFEPTVGGLQVPPPFAFTGLKVFGFPLLADIAPLKALCDDFLAIAPASAHITFEPIPATTGGLPRNVALVTMQAIDYVSINSTTAPWDDFGGAPQKEIYFAVPVVMKHNGVVVDVGVFLPYVFVDNFVSAVTAREVLGFPKVLAKFQFDRHFPTEPIVMKFNGKKTLRGPFTQSQLLKVTSPSGLSVPFAPLVTIGMFFGPLEMLFAGSPYAALLNAAHGAGVYAGFSARTVIDPTAPATDSIRAIYRSRYTMSNVTASGLLAPVSVSFTPFFGLDIAQTLGIVTTGSGKAVPVGPFFLECDLLLDGVTALWSS